MKKYHLLYVASALLLSGLASCEDMLTEDPDSSYKKSNTLLPNQKPKCQSIVYTTP